MIRSFAHKGLAEIWRKGTTQRIDSRLYKRVLRRLDRLNASDSPADMDLPGFDFHTLRGHRPVRYAVHVNGPWCITFAFDGVDAVDVDFEQYH